ncbi:PREDICTED: sialic acid-binding Ig-like lectin 9 [Cyprinodon variegatus]|uniref:sialic acid-binding Ig-like lectin 9 n=1 Tax=Cyprinodon variegatus TaxID=28743 RepID=UPI0007428B53|nr:PREDICTED: sialic acid-binding Ig-like lectin 9 [Cyprinodon variegatus]
MTKMTGKLLLFLTVCLLKDAICSKFEASLQSTVEVLRGCFVTIPCSFDFEDNYKKDFTDKCVRSWVDNNNLALVNKTKIIGKLQEKNCTTEFKVMKPETSNIYYFRLDCNNDLKYSYKKSGLHFQVKEHFPPPTLTPSVLEVTEGESVNLTCSAPNLCPFHPPTLTWIPILGSIQETLRENKNKTMFKISVLNFTASRHHQNISCTAVYKAQNGTSVSTEKKITGNILFTPLLLPTSNCTETESQINCTCETLSNIPMIQWLLDGKPINQSSKVPIITVPLNKTYLRSIAILDKTQSKNRSSLICISFNHLGLASKEFLVDLLKTQDKQLLIVFTTTIAILLVIVCVLVLIIRFQKIQHAPEINTVGAKEVTDMPEDIYVNTTELWNQWT